jgi:hypothetical protein
MAFPKASGHPAYTDNFIPEIWSGKIVENFYDATVLSAISNTDYEGEIKKFGDVVNIRTTPSITLRDYKKGDTLTIENPDSAKIQLLIDKGEYFAAIEDDVDKVQADLNLMNMWTKDASERMKVKIDSRVLTDVLGDVHAKNKGETAGAISGNINLGVTGASKAIVLSTGNVIDHIIAMGQVLDEANAPESDRFLVIPAFMAALLKRSDLKDASITGDSQSPMRNGRLGMIDRFTLYTSHNLKKDAADDKGTHLLAGNKMGLTFASQMTNMETLRSTTTFGDIIRGLQVYGYKVTKGEALVTSVVK